VRGAPEIITEYRLYCLDGDGDCTKEHLLGAADDSDAIAQIEIMQVQSKCELWERARLVVELPPYGP
jgi:hypothetical protein